MTRTYRMSAAQSEDWTLGGAAAQQVAEEIHQDIADEQGSADYLVLVDDGAVAFTVWQSVSSPPIQGACR